MTSHLSSAEAQLSLGFGHDIPTERLFFAVLPDEHTAERITELAYSLCEQHQLNGHVIEPERLHITLHHIGDYAVLPPSLLGKVRQAARRVRRPEFQVCLDQVGSVTGSDRHPYVMRSETGEELFVALQQELARCMAGIVGKPARASRPHLTLLYDSRRLPVQPVQPLRWWVREFVLVRSFLGQSRYQIEGRWSLG